MKQQGKVIIAIILIILIAVFALLNTTAVPINFGITIVTWPLVLVILGSLLLGALLLFLLSTVSSIKSSRELKRQSDEYLSQLDVLQHENESLKRRVNQQPKTIATTKPTDKKDDPHD